MKKRDLVTICSILFCAEIFAQIYPPPVGSPGTTAIYKDSSVFVNWVSGCKVERGFQNIANPGLGYASAGDSSLVLGKAMSNGIVSLGDGGWAICEFPYPIQDGPGFDFAVFENGFDNYFLELATVEVSSDGQNYFPFPSHSLTDTTIQKASFDSLDAKKLNNLAGKYRGGYGTPFDLQELQAQSGLDVNAVRYVKIVDVVGCIQSAFAHRDVFQNKINDPWPTPFASGGFDLDAVGVIHQNIAAAMPEQIGSKEFFVFPNPAASCSSLHLSTDEKIVEVVLVSGGGSRRLLNASEQKVQLPELAPGFYILEIQSASGLYYKKIAIGN